MFTFTKVCWILSLLTNIFINIRLEKGRKQWFPHIGLCDYSLSCIKMNLYFGRNDIDTKILNI